MKFLIQDGAVRAPASDEEIALGIFDIRDLSHVAGVAPGWVAHDDGSYSPPVVATPTVADLLAYASASQNAALAGVWSFNVAASGAPAHTVTTRLDDRGQFAMLKVQGWLTLNAGRADAAMPYSNIDFSATTLTPAEADSLVEQAAAVDERGYAILNVVAAKITAIPPGITTAAEIDAAFAAMIPTA